MSVCFGVLANAGEARRQSVTTARVVRIGEISKSSTESG
jgi:hypothetical protein